jgi:hypothetical protein
MPTWLGTGYNIDYSGYPAHMAVEDYSIWQRIKDKLLIDAKMMYFDVGLGGAKNIPNEYEPSFIYMWERLNQKRIDVLTDTGEEWHIIELRPRATSTAIGRLLQYRELWNLEPIDTRPIKLILGTDLPDPDVISLAAALKIEIITP